MNNQKLYTLVNALVYIHIKYSEKLPEHKFAPLTCTVVFIIRNSDPTDTLVHTWNTLICPIYHCALRLNVKVYRMD